jgi:hypothetical protein
VTALAGEDFVEGQGTAGARFVLVEIAHRCSEIDTKLQRMSTDRFGKSIEPLKLLRYLLLRQEIGRPDESNVLDGSLGNSASDGWIPRNARNKFIHLILAKRILFGE